MHKAARSRRYVGGVTESIPPIPPVRRRGRRPVDPSALRGLPGLKRAIASRGWTQSELARMLNIDVAAVNAWANGKRDPGASTVRDIAAVLRTTADNLLAVNAALATPAAPAA